MASQHASLVSALLVLAMPLPTVAADAAQNPDASREAQVDALFAAWDAPGSPGCAVGVMSRGRLVYAKGHGLADVARGIPLSADTVFDVASMTKQFTAASIALLSMERKLALADDVRTRFPEIRIDAPVTIEDLLHHSSGLRDYAELNQLRGTEAIDNKGVLALLARQNALNFPPGQESSYSNSNYVLLAELVPQASGLSLARFANERIFGPLQMTSTRYASGVDEDPPNLANSYFPTAPGQFSPVPRSTQTVGDGNLLTTVRDLALWDENFYTNRVGGPALTGLMRAPARLANGQQAPYGLGLMFDTYRGLPTEHHGGSYHGFRTELLRFPQQHFSVSVLCNVASANASALATQVADIYLADALQPRAVSPVAVAVAIEPATFDAHAGPYLLDNRGQRNVMFVGRQVDRFFAQAVGEPPVELLPLSANEFFVRGADARMSFERGQNGATDRMILQQGDLTLIGRKLARQAAPAEVAAALAGAYYSPELESGLSLEDLSGQPAVNMGGGRRLPLIPVSEDSYVMPGGAMLQMQRDAEGRIRGFDYSSPRVRNLRFERKDGVPQDRTGR